MATIDIKTVCRELLPANQIMSHRRGEKSIKNIYDLLKNEDGCIRPVYRIYAAAGREFNEFYEE